MDTVITLGFMVKVLLIMVALVLLFGGAFVSFAAGMASAPSAEDRKTRSRGCFAAIAGLALGVYSIFFW